MSAADIERLEGKVNGVLFADNPTSPTPSIAAQATSAARSVSAPIQQKAQDLINTVSSLAQPLQQTAQGVVGAIGNLGQSALGAVRSGAEVLGGALPDVTGTLQSQAATGPLQTVASGQPVSATGQLAAAPAIYGGASAATEQAAENINPLRDVPVVGGIVNQTLNPLMGGPLGTVTAGTDIASLGSKLASPLIGGVADVARDVTAETPQAVQSIATSGAPAQASAGLAATLGGAAAGGGAAYLGTDENDPNRWLKVAGGAAAGAGLTGFGIGAARGVMGAAPPALTNTAPVTLRDVFNQYHSGNVISGAATLTHVMVNSILSPAWSFVTRGAADLAGGAAGAITGGRVGLDTGFSRLQGSGVGVVAGLASAGEDFGRALAQHFMDPNSVANRLGGAGQLLPPTTGQQVGSALLNAQGTFAALHSAFQSAAQGIIARTELGRLAGEEATQQGLKGSAWIQAVSNMIDSPGPAMLQEAQGVAERAALKGDLGTLGSKMRDISQVPFAGNTLFPVVRIAANALAQGIEKSPIGLLGTGYDVLRGGGRFGLPAGPYGGAAGLAGNGIVAPLAERLTNNLAGTALTAWLLQKSTDGTITGNGPTDPRQRAMLQSQGWQPNSIYVPGRGYTDYHALGPLAVTLSIAGNYHDAVAYAKAGANPQQIALDLADRIGGYLSDATGLRTIGELYNTLHGGASVGATAAQFLGNVAGGFVPESAAIRSGVTAFDPNLRKVEPGNLQQVIQQGLPSGTPLIGGRTDLPIKQDVLGRSEANPEAGLGTFLPRAGSGQPDPTLTLLANAGIDLAANSPKTINYQGRQLALTPDEQQSRQEIFGQQLQKRLQGFLNSTRFQAEPPDQQYKALEPIVRAAGTYADQRMVAQMDPTDRKARLALAPRAYGAGVVPYVGAGGGGIASLLARQSAAEADAAHQRLVQQMASQPQVQVQPAAVGQ